MKDFPPSKYSPCDYMESSSSNVIETTNLIRWKSGKKVDPKILALLEVFGEIYANRHEFFKKIFDGDHEELFKNIVGDVMKMKRKQKKMKKSRSMQRSLSMRVIGRRGFDDESDELKIQWFRVRAPIVTVAEPDDQSNGGSKHSK